MPQIKVTLETLLKSMEDWVKLVDAQIKEYVDADTSYDKAGRQEAVMKTIHDMSINEGDFGRWVEAARKKPRPQP